MLSLSGLLIQSRDNELFQKWDIVTKAKPSQEQIDEMAFGMTVGMFAKSNAILVIKDKAAIGIGCGQTNRIWAASQALERAKAIGTTALFASKLLPDWKQLMPDDTDTLRKILEYAEKRAIVPQDHADLANWYKKYLNIDKSKEEDNAIL